jgi:hypothetical protein
MLIVKYFPEQTILIRSSLESFDAFSRGFLAKTRKQSKLGNPHQKLRMSIKESQHG